MATPLSRLVNTLGFLLAAAAVAAAQEAKGTLPPVSAEVRDLLTAAERLRAAGRAGEALRLLAERAKKEPHPAVRFALGLAAHAAGELERAAAAFRAVLEEVPGYAPAQRNLARVLLEQGRPGEAAALLRALLRAQAHPEPGLLRTLAAAYLEAGDVQAARAAYGRAVEVAPNDREARVGWVLAVLRTGPAEVAAAEAEAALARFPGEVRLLRLLATALLRLGRYEEATDAMAAAAYLGRAEAADWRTLGDLYLRLGLAREAAGAYERVLAGGAADPETERRLARALAAAGRPERAREVLAKLCRRASQDPEVWLARGRLEESLGRRDEARRAYERARRLGAGGRAALALGRLAWAAGDAAAAEEALRAAARETNQATAVEAWLLLGQLYERQGRREAAVRAYREVLAREPDRREAYLGLLRVER